MPYHTNIFVKLLFSAKFNKTPVYLSGKTKPFSGSLETTLDINLKDVDVPYYFAYLPMELNCKFLKGYLDTKLTVSYEQHKRSSPTLSVSGNVDLRTMEITDAKDNPLLKFSRLHLSIASTELISKKIHLAKILLDSPEVNIERDSTGKINIQSILWEEKTQEPPTESDKSTPPVSIHADSIELAAGKVFFTDFSQKKPFRTTLGPVDININNFSNAKDKMATINLSLQTEVAETLKLDSEFSLDPLAADITLQIQGVRLEKYSPYYADAAPFAVEGGNLDLKLHCKYAKEGIRSEVTLSDTSATIRSLTLKKYEGKEPVMETPAFLVNVTFSTTGNLLLESSNDRQISLAYNGQAAISDLETIDKAQGDYLIKWKDLRFVDIDFGHNPSYVKIGEISLDNPYADVIVNPDRKLNLQALAPEKKQKEEEEKTDTPKKKEEVLEPINIDIDKVTLRAGRINFQDRSIEPRYSAELAEIQGDISGLSSEGTKTADVRLSAKLDGYAPFEIVGKINPLKDELFADLEIDFKDMDLSTVSPYAGRYVGYALEKGKLSFDLKYLIDKKKLDAENNIFLDQFTFGDKVDSPEAVKLPVKLAVALLQNRKGEIDLSLPVTGRIDDPEFRVGKVVLKVIMNLLVKAATSPFALLGAIFEGGEDLSFLEFDYGIFNIRDQSKKKLDTLIKALYDRPSLKLDIEGHVDIENDREGMRKYLFDKKLKAQKLNKMMKKGLPAVPVDEVVIEPSEYEEYLRKAYKAEKFEKPRNIIGLVKKLPVPETERLLLEHIEVEDADLRLLAIQRSQQVKGYILRSDRIEAARIFIVEPKSLEPGDKTKSLKDSRVNLMLN